MWFRRSRSASGANRLQPPELSALRGASPRPAWWWLTLPTGHPLWPSTSTPAVVDWPGRTWYCACIVCLAEGGMLKQLSQNKGLAFFKHYRQHADALPGDDEALESPRVRGPSWSVLLSVPFFFRSPYCCTNSILQDRCHRLVQPGLVWRLRTTRTPNTLGTPLMASLKISTYSPAILQVCLATVLPQEFFFAQDLTVEQPNASRQIHQ